MKPAREPHPPPRLALRLFRWYCHPALQEDIEGDLLELFEERATQEGIRKARWLFVRDVLALFRPSILRPFHLYNPVNHPSMLKNYFKTGFRNLWKHKSYAALNISGLALGIAAAILLFLIIQYENSFDKFHTDYEDTYQIREKGTNANGEVDFSSLTRTPAFPAMREEYPEVVGGSRFDENRHWIGYDDKMFQSPVHYVDTSFATTFSFNTVAGDAKVALNTPNHLVLTQTVAKKFFGDENPLGKILDLDQGAERFTVGAVMEDPPKNSSLQFEILIPWLNAPDDYHLDQNGNWYNSNMTAFIKLAPGTDPQEFERKLIPFKEKYYTPYEGEETQISLLPLDRLRAEKAQNEALITLLSVIAVIILLIATVNFMNLSMAQSLGRAREIGIRKVMGSLREQLISQFLTESTLTSIFALLIAILLVHITLPWINEYFSLGLSFSYWKNISLLLVLLGIGLTTGILSGLYPALFISGFQPAKSLKGVWRRSTSGKFFQKSLIIVQYACSILLIAGTILIWRQIHFMKTQNLNFNQHNMVVLWMYPDSFKDAEQAKSHLKVLKDKLKQETAIQSVAFSNTVPSRYWYNYNGFYPAGQPSENRVSLRQSAVDHDYFPTYGIAIVAGRNFSSELASDSNAVMINQTAMHAFGWHDIESKYLISGGSNTQFHVVGVTEDFHYQGLQSKIEPMIHFYGGSEPGYPFMSVKLNPDQIKEGIALLKDSWKSLNPLGDFDYFFIDQEFDKMYKEQERIGSTATLFAFIAIIIASLGLLGLAAFATRQRRKEVGVRKVLGASVVQIVLLLSKNFAWLVLIAFGVACPLIYYTAQQFLQDFAYRIDVSSDIFIIAGMAAFAIAGISVSVQSARAASANPVDSLRDE